MGRRPEYPYNDSKGTPARRVDPDWSHINIRIPRTLRNVLYKQARSQQMGMAKLIEQMLVEYTQSIQFHPDMLKRIDGMATRAKSNRWETAQRLMTYALNNMERLLNG